jgi:DNA-directed RNA polymerase subunit alpha
MNRLIFSVIQKNIKKNIYGNFIFEPLLSGHAVTIGNAIRRVLFSGIYGYGIYAIKINDAMNEFSVVEEIREDIFDLILNLREIIFKNYSIEKFKNIKGFLNLQGPMIVTAGCFYLPKKTLSIVNPFQYLCTIVEQDFLYLEIFITYNKGYEYSERYTKGLKHFNETLKLSNLIFIDNSYTPIRKVNFKVNAKLDQKGFFRESLELEIITNGSITPQKSLKEALKILLKLFYSVFSAFKFTKFYTNLICLRNLK